MVFVIFRMGFVICVGFLSVSFDVQNCICICDVQNCICHDFLGNFRSFSSNKSLDGRNALLVEKRQSLRFPLSCVAPSLLARCLRWHAHVLHPLAAASDCRLSRQALRQCAGEVVLSGPVPLGRARLGRAVAAEVGELHTAGQSSQGGSAAADFTIHDLQSVLENLGFDGKLLGPDPNAAWAQIDSEVCFDLVAARVVGRRLPAPRAPQRPITDLRLLSRVGGWAASAGGPS